MGVLTSLLLSPLVREGSNLRTSSRRIAARKWRNIEERKFGTFTTELTSFPVPFGMDGVSEELTAGFSFFEVRVDPRLDAAKWRS